jgi:hypothetical protein
LIEYSLSIDWLCSIIDIDRRDGDGCRFRRISINVVTITGVYVDEEMRLLFLTDSEY